MQPREGKYNKYNIVFELKNLIKDIKEIDYIKDFSEYKRGLII